MGERAADPQNHFNLDNYEKLDLRAGLESKFGEVCAFADKLLNQTYDTYGFYSDPVARWPMALRHVVAPWAWATPTSSDLPLSSASRLLH